MWRRFAVMLAVTLVVASGLLLAGCGGGDQEGYGDPSKPIVVEKGEEFTIALPAEPEAGYGWRLAEPLHEETISLVKREFERAKQGESGKERWTFKAQGLGVTHLTFSYGRLWKGEGDRGQETPGAKKETAGESAAGTKRDAQTQAPGHADFVKTVKEGEPLQGPVEQAGTPEEMRVTFTVDVRKKGSKGKEPKKFQDPSEEIVVERGYKFSVVLESTPAEGKGWILAGALPAQLRLSEVRYEEKGKAHHGDEHGEGHAAGMEIWVFDPVEPGEAKIEFQLEDHAGKVLESKAFKVRVEKEVESASKGH